MSTIRIKGVDKKLLEHQRLVLLKKVFNERLAFSDEEAEAMQGVLAMLDEWGDQEFYGDGHGESLMIETKNEVDERRARCAIQALKKFFDAKFVSGVADSYGMNLTFDQRFDYSDFVTQEDTLDIQVVDRESEQRFHAIVTNYFDPMGSVNIDEIIAALDTVINKKEPFLRRLDFSLTLEYDEDLDGYDVEKAEECVANDLRLAGYKGELESKVTGNSMALYPAWDFEDWESRFVPVINAGQIVSYDEPPEGVPENKVWTVVDADGVSFAIPGIHYVNRLFYVETRKTWNSDDRDMEVLW